jgi:class 3 adenylate cyclase
LVRHGRKRVLGLIERAREGTVGLANRPTHRPTAPRSRREWEPRGFPLSVQTPVRAILIASTIRRYEVAVTYEYRSLEDFLVSTQLSVDAVLDDGWGAPMPVKGREITATVLFADMAAFTSRTLDMSAAETLIFVQWFFAWIGAEALKSSKGIVDKYIGDEVMIVFSNEFGSEDSFADAVRTARWMAEHDAWSFAPQMGIASGRVVVGYVGTPTKYDCSVFGAPVAMAARCAGVTPALGEPFSSAIVFPASEWGDRSFDEVFPPRRYQHPEHGTVEQPHSWEMLAEREVPLKNLPNTPIREIVNRGIHFPSQTVESATKEVLDEIKRAGRYWPSDS